MSQQIPVSVRTDATKKLKMAAQSLSAIGILTLFIGGVVWAAASSQEGAFVFVFFLLTVGGLYIFLGAMIKRRSNIALIAATILTGLNLISGLLTLSLIGILVSAALLSQLIPCFSAIKAFE